MDSAFVFLFRIFHTNIGMIVDTVRIVSSVSKFSIQDYFIVLLILSIRLSSTQADENLSVI